MILYKHKCITFLLCLGDGFDKPGSGKYSNIQCAFMQQPRLIDRVSQTKKLCLKRLTNVNT